MVPDLLKSGGFFVLQTLHPATYSENTPYVDEWRPGSWDGFSNDFVDPAPFYFRRVGSWIDLFVRNGFTIECLEEPIHPVTERPVSMILVGKRSKDLSLY